ncbi:ASST-domain-containing protein [Phyllosticta capitalensis]
MRLVLAALPALVSALPSTDFNSLWYDQGLFGAYPSRDYVSFDLSSPRVNILTWSTQCDPGQIFLEPRGKSVAKPGPMILDAEGHLVYMEQKFGEAMDFRPQTYKGEDYLTFWSGTDDGTHGRGSYYMLNSSYDVARVVNPTNGLEGDLHEFEITPNGTALMSIYEIIPADLSSVGGPKDGWIYDGLFQELDIETGEAIFQWRASSFYHVNESYAPLKKKGRSKDDAWDYFHINSVDKDSEGNYYISARYTHTITCIGPDGQVRWRLGGQHSDFTDLSHGAASNFSWQHHMRYFENDTTLTIFDNGAYDNNFYTADYSRGLYIQLDLANMTAKLIADYVSPAGILAHSQGSVQLLENGNAFVGWGHSAAFTEFKRDDGEVLCDMHFGSSAFFGWGWIKSYRAFKGNWVGRPTWSPSIARRKSRVYVSWNGATEVKKWTLQAAADTEGNFTDVSTVDKVGFESSFHLAGKPGQFLRAAALDKDGEVLGYSPVLDSRMGQLVDGTFSPITDDDLVFLQFLLGLLACGTLGTIVWNLYPSLRLRRFKRF